MITIELDGKTVTADTVPDAVVRLRKLAHQAERDRIATEKLRAQALLHAKAHACGLYERLLQKQDCPRAWCAYPVGHPFATFCVRDLNPYTYSIDVSGVNGTWTRCKVETWGQTITHAVINGSGFVWGLFTTDSDSLVRF